MTHQDILITRDEARRLNFLGSNPGDTIRVTVEGHGGVTLEVKNVFVLIPNPFDPYPDWRYQDEMEKQAHEESKQHQLDNMENS